MFGVAAIVIATTADRLFAAVYYLVTILVRSPAAGGGDPVMNSEICTRSTLAAMSLVIVSLGGGCGSGDTSGTSNRSNPAPASSHAGAPVKPSLPLGTPVKLPTGNTIAVTKATWWTPTAGGARPGLALLTVRAVGCASASNTTTTYIYEDDFSVLLDDGSSGNVDYSAPAVNRCSPRATCARATAFPDG